MVEVVRTPIEMGVRNSSRTYAAEAEKQIVENGERGTSRTGGQSDRIYSGEETELVVEVIRTHPTSLTPKTDNGNITENTPTVTDIGGIEG